MLTDHLPILEQPIPKRVRIHERASYTYANAIRGFPGSKIANVSVVGKLEPPEGASFLVIYPDYHPDHGKPRGAPGVEVNSSDCHFAILSYVEDYTPLD